MRVIAGSLGGRMLHEPRGHRTHPMSEKIRGALFNILGDVSGLSFLDGFAGSGAIAIEAVSRGAASAVAIERDRPAHDALERNVSELGLSKQVKAIRANAGGWSDKNQQKTFDVVIFDPPYDDLQFNLLQKLLAKHLKSGGVAALSWPGHIPLPSFDGAEAVSNKDYGDAQLVFYRKNS